MPLKQVIIVRQDLKLPKGKLAAQVAHASVEAVMKSEKEIVKEWRQKGSKKVVLKVETEKDLFRFKELAKANDLVSALITDAGKTVIAPGTRTCLAIGPDDEEKIDELTAKLGMI